MAERLHVRISGRVQGVGFRYATVREAQHLGLTGWVRNLANGVVEAEFEGMHDQLESMLVWCGRGPSFAVVENVETQWESGEPRYRSFTVR